MRYGLLAGLVIFTAYLYVLAASGSPASLRQNIGSLWVFYVIALLALTLSMGIFVVRALHIARSKRWPYTAGTIESAEYGPAGWKISYSYRVNDTPYQNDVFSSEEAIASASDVALHITHTPEVTSEILLGRRVRVYYDPEDATKSVLFHADEPTPWLLLIPSTVTVAACVFFGFVIYMAGRLT